uniref:Uncharacterized protein n=1 Tax=Rhizophora mucronata TaxID=61149 RepID=A0A2P2QU23_RHIMU
MFVLLSFFFSYICHFLNNLDYFALIHCLESNKKRIKGSKSVLFWT